MTPLWTASDLQLATGGTVQSPFSATGVSIDTRTLKPGDLFVALLGEGRDGHAFVADALARGAAGAMVHRPLPELPNAPLLLVDDTLSALTRLGGFARSRMRGKVVAITGSVGKTTTKEMLRTVLATFGSVHAAEASYNNHWGLPLTLARMPADSAFGVLEIGMNHPGEIAPLTLLARPHVAAITTVEKAHIGHMGSLEAIADEKASIFLGLTDGGTAVLLADTPMFTRLRAAAGTADILTFGETSDAYARLKHYGPEATGSDISASIGGQELHFRLRAAGRHMALNALAALTIVHALGLDLLQAARALENFSPLVGRGARRDIAVSGGTALLLDESYNANGASVRAALDVLKLQPARRRVAVLGDMLELGEASASEHAGLAKAVTASADIVFAAGPWMRNLFDALPKPMRGAHADTSAELAPIVAAALRAGDAMLVKGSLGSRMKTIVDAIEAAREQAHAV